MFSGFVEPSENVISPLLVFTTSLVASIDLTVPTAVRSTAAFVCVAAFDPWAANAAADPVSRRLAVSAAARYVRMIQTPLIETHNASRFADYILRTTTERE